MTRDPPWGQLEAYVFAGGCSGGKRGWGQLVHHVLIGLEDAGGW